MSLPTLETLKLVTFEEICRRIRAREPFSWLRYGDGEWGAAFQEIRVEKGNCDGHHFFREMGKDLEKSLTRPLPSPAIYGMQKMMLRRESLRVPLHAWLGARNIDIDWHDADVIHYANRDGELGLLVQALGSRDDVVLVGPRHLTKGLNLFPIWERVRVGDRNCYLEKEKVVESIRALAKTRPSAIFLFSASMATETFIYELFPSIGQTATMIDIGSVWDIYVGRKSRNYLRQMPHEVMKRNMS